MKKEKRFITNQNQATHGELLYEELTYKIRGCLFQIYNILGPGHKEIIYQNALELELTRQKLTLITQKSFSVFYKNKKIGVYKPDLIIEDKIIIETKATTLNLKIFENQLLSYLKATPYQLGLLVNFGTDKLYIKRIIDTK